MKFTPYSHSKLETFVSCPKKFDFQYIQKLRVPKKENEATEKGSYFHFLLEHYGNKLPDYEIKEELKLEVEAKYKEFLDGKLAKYVMTYPTLGIEVAYGLDSKFNPVSYYSKEAVSRGYIDRIVKDGDKFILVDFKTGKLKDLQYQSWDQLKQYAIHFFKAYPVDEVDVSYVYVEHGEEHRLTLKREFLKNYIKDLALRIRDVELAEEFPKIEKFCDWCDYKELCFS